VTRDEAIRQALTDLEPGQTLSVHEEHCLFVPSDDGETFTCTCIPERWTCPA
jgi:hypothetical protein